MSQRIKPSIVIPGRKGKSSVADVVIEALWPKNDYKELPQKSLTDLTSICIKKLGFSIKSSTLRSTLYRHPEIFEKAGQSGRLAYYRLCEDFMENCNEK